MRIIEKIDRLMAKNTPFYSFEYFPPKSAAAERNLFARIDRMASLNPAFVDITWGAGGSTTAQTLKIATTLQEFFGVEVMMHLTCTNMTKAGIDDALTAITKGGVMNVLALRGDPPHGQKQWVSTEGGFRYASDLTRHIRAQHGKSLCVGVAGYPEGHIDATSLEEDIEHLRTKVLAGADFVVTQLFYDVERYFDYVKRCRAAGITCPIIPGVMPIYGYERFMRFTQLCNTHVPDAIRRALDPIRHDDAAVQAYGVEQCTDLCQKLLDGGAPGLHFYTLNLEGVVAAVLRKLGLARDDESRRDLPWRPSAHPDRREEKVRPIFWSNRPKSYVARTAAWDAYPNGRWGPSASPAFGDLNDHYLFRSALGQQERRDENRKLWGDPSSVAEVGALFTRFCDGELERLPWCDGPLQKETSQLQMQLRGLNRAGYWTISSQPAVNGKSSRDPEVGWGGPDGRVYQKAYLEFFASPELTRRRVERLARHPLITFTACNRAGETFTNCDDGHVNAVTWGVFPVQEILQPTVVDPVSFRIWREEAFDLWLSEWASLYEDGSEPKKVLTTIQETYFLVNMVDNDYVEGDIFAPFEL